VRKPRRKLRASALEVFKYSNWRCLYSKTIFGYDDGDGSGLWCGLKWARGVVVRDSGEIDDSRKFSFQQLLSERGQGVAEGGG
jgi:hypothetical protein